VRAAFTLIELILVIVLVGVIAVMAWPNVDRYADAEQLRESAQRLKALIAMCRAEAMNQTRRYRVEFAPDGTLRTLMQRDPLAAPHEYVPPPADWAQREILRPGVRIEAVQPLPEGPPPIRIVDEKLVFPETEIHLTPVGELDPPARLDFEPDGSCPSMRWLLRDAAGRAVLVTLDGRTSRVGVEPWTGADDASQVEQPAPPAAETVRRLQEARR